MFINIKLCLFLLIVAVLLNSCLTPMDGTGSGNGNDSTYINRIDLYAGNSWVFNINSSAGNYRDSFFVKDSRMITYDNHDLSVYKVAFPALQNRGTDTLLLKYWRIDEITNSLIEYGWEKRSAFHGFEFSEKIYPQAITVANFNSITDIILFEDFTQNGALKISQSAKHFVTANGKTMECIGVTYYCTEQWNGFPVCDYTIKFSNQGIFKINGYIENVSFSTN